MGQKNTLYGLLLLIAITMLAAFLTGCEEAGSEVPPPPPITTFEECVAEGHPILESYPRQCTVPGGDTFAEEVEEGACLVDSDCDEGSFCNRGECLEFVLDQTCADDEDCVLIDSEFNLGCCWTTKCKPIDYSDEEWIAVNEELFTGQQEEYCAKEEACGSAPVCSEMIINRNFKAVCAEGECDKVPT